MNCNFLFSFLMVQFQNFHLLIWLKIFYIFYKIYVNFFQMLGSGDFFSNDILKRKSKKNLKILGMCVFNRYFYIKNYEEHLRHRHHILIEFSRSAPIYRVYRGYLSHFLFKDFYILRLIFRKVVICQNFE